MSELAAHKWLAVDDEWSAFGRTWMRHLRGFKGRPASTVKLYAQGLGNLADWARAQGISTPVDVDADILADYFIAFRERTNKDTGKPLSDAYVRRDYSSLRQFFKWAAVVAKRMPDVMADLGMPKANHKTTQILSLPELQQLIEACATTHGYIAHPKTSGLDFAARRDEAMIRVLAECGLRRGEIMGLTVDAVTWTENGKGELAIVSGPGRKTGARRVPFGVKTGEALSLYMLARERHRDAKLDELWLASSPHRGAMGIDGLRLMLNRRAKLAGVDNVHPHRFRHTAYDAYARDGLDGTAAMSIFGWSTRSMLDLYAKSNAHNRAVDAAHKLSPGDRI